MRRLYVALVLLLAGVIAMPSRSQQPAALDEDTLPRGIPALATADAPSSIEELRRKIAVVLEREGVPGVGLALVNRDGPIWIGGVGVADLTTRTPVTADTAFRVASITKSFIGLGVMRLVEQGKLDLDRPLRELLPDVAIDNAWDDGAPVTLAQVLEHTAGLDDMRPNETFTADDAVMPVDALKLNSRSRVIRWRPGSRMAYSNVGYTLAARAIEVVTHMPFDVWMRREVLIPLGIPDADFRRTDALASRLATGHIDRDRPVRFAPIAHRPAGSLLASPTDLAKLVQFWLRRGDGTSIVSPAGLDRIERSSTLPFPRTDIDYGLGNYGDVGHPVRSRGHDGGLPGFGSVYRYFPQLGVGYVMLLNATHSRRAYIEIRQLLFAYLTHGRTFAQPAIAEPCTGPSAEFFSYANPRHALFGFLDRTLLGWRATETPGGVDLDPLIGPPIGLIATADGGYRFPGESGTSLRFTNSRDGTPVMVGGGAYAEAASWWPARAKVIALGIAVLLLELAPVWAVGVLLLAIVRRRRVVAIELTLWPAIAGLCFVAMPQLFIEAAQAQVLGDVHPLTVGFFAATLAFALASAASVRAAVRWSIRPDRPSLWRRFVPSACAAAAFALTIWFGANGIIGLRTWAW